MAESFLREPSVLSASARALYDEDLADDGYVWNASRLHAHQPETMRSLMRLSADAFEPSRLSPRLKTILVLATTSTLGDSYCSMAWGRMLASAGSPEVAASVLAGGDDGLDAQESALAAWARLVADDPNATTEDDVERLRATGLDDEQIFAITAFVAIRIAIATVNDALSAHPDPNLADSLPGEIRDAVTYGRTPEA
jgi:alkylhydroperoxidase family enzyme